MLKYNIRYALKGEPMSEYVQAPNPIAAIDKFHKSMQLLSEIAHEDYKILSLGLVYNLDPTGNCRLKDVESRYDVPTTPNPDLKPVKRKERVLEVPFSFMSEPLNGRLAE